MANQQKNNLEKKNKRYGKVSKIEEWERIKEKPDEKNGREKERDVMCVFV